MITRVRCHRAVALLALTFFGCSKRAEPEIYLIPDGYRGPVVIIFDDPAAPPVAYEGDSRVYEIPRGGVLRTSSDVNEGVWLDIAYFFVEHAGARSELRLADRSQQAERAAVYDPTTGSIQCDEDSERVTSHAFFVADGGMQNIVGRARAFADSVVCTTRQP